MCQQFLNHIRANPPTIKYYFLLGELHWMIFNPDITGHQQGLWPGVIFWIELLEFFTVHLSAMMAQ